MPTINRNDGLPFVVQPYRELLASSKRSALLSEIKMQAEQQGHYLHLYKKENEKIEAVFSKEPGYLLGESIWEYFGRPAYLIYCEPVEATSNVIIVVVREASIFMDAQVSANRLRAELLPLMTRNEKYRFVTHGAVPLTETRTKEFFSFPQEQIASFERLDYSVLNTLPVSKLVQLQPLAITLKSNLLGYRFWGWTVLALGVFLAAFLGWMLNYAAFKTTTNAQFVVQIRPQPYAEYVNAMLSPEPAQQLTMLANVVERTYLMPGWHTDAIHLESDAVAINTVSDGGDMATLNRWSREHQFNFNVTSNGAQLGLQLQSERRTIPPKILRTQDVLVSMIDQIDRLLHDKAVAVSTTQNKGIMQLTPITIKLDHVSPAVLGLLGQELEGMPVTLQTVDVTLDNGLMNGNIELSVWGTAS